MKERTKVFISIGSIVIIMAVAFWWMTSGQIASALTALTSNDHASATVEQTGDIAKASAQTENPVVSPHGNAAGGIVDVRSMTVAQVVAELPDAAKFQALMAQANVSVAGSGQFTVFVPVDGAFGFDQVASMTAAEKVRLVQYHVVKGKGMDVDAMTAGSVQALSGDLINFSFSTNKIPLVGSGIVITQYNCANGVVYTMDNVLLPPRK